MMVAIADSILDASTFQIPSDAVPYYLFVLWYYDSIFDTQNVENRNFTENFISMASVFHQNLIDHKYGSDVLYRSDVLYNIYL